MGKLMVENIEVKLTNLDKVLWPEQGITKGDMINYYVEVYQFIKEYLKDRPLSLKAFPDGIDGKTFYQKNAPDHAPHWLSTYPIYSGHREDAINWVLINKLQDLLWVANMASIELHGWFSTVKDIRKPSFAVFDLDPGTKTGFSDAVEVALIIKKFLDQLNLISFIKTSGKSGLHIYLPVEPVYNFKQVKKFLQAIAEMVVELRPQLATLEWRKKDRGGKLYIDYRQNEKGKTIPAPYSLRPTNEATVSAPLLWDELKQNLDPRQFTMETIKDRLILKGDLWSDLFQTQQKLPADLI